MKLSQDVSKIKMHKNKSYKSCATPPKGCCHTANNSIVLINGLSLEKWYV